MSHLQRVLVVQEKFDQGRLWSLSFESQGFNVIQDCPRVDFLEDLNLGNLSLLILDMSSKLLNPYDVCRELRDQAIYIPIFLTHSVQRNPDPVERRWAMNQGATDLIPNLINGLTAMAQLPPLFEQLGWLDQFNLSTLEVTLINHGYLNYEVDFFSAPSPPTQPPVTAPLTQPPVTAPLTQPSIVPRPTDPIFQEPTNKTSKRSKRVVMYRGQPMEV